MAFQGNVPPICINSVLPVDIIGEIISKLPLASIIRARLVCKTWNRIRLPESPPSSRKSWYVSLRCGTAYDLALDSWWNLKSLSFGKPCRGHAAYPYVAFCPGLVCLLVPDYNGLKICVCNPITRFLRMLPDLPFPLLYTEYGATISMSAGRVPGTYIIVVITMVGIYTNVEPCTQAGIHVYSSEKLAWETREDVFLPFECDWGQHSSVICDEVLYFQGRNNAGHFLCAHGLFSGTCLGTSSSEEYRIARPHANGKSLLMSVRGKLATVELFDESAKVWLLDGKEWTDVATMPHEYIERFDVTIMRFSGFDEIIYLRDPVSGKLVIFDMATRRWRLIEGLSCSSEGTYFEPRFDAIP